MRKYFPKPKYSGGCVKGELDWSNYAKKKQKKNKTDFKKATGADTSKFDKKFDLANLKSDADKSDIDKLKNVPANLRKQKSKVHNLDVDKLILVPVDLVN